MIDGTAGRRSPGPYRPLLVLLTGPVGGGKSTVAEALAERLRRSGRTAGVIDLDLVYCMARQQDGWLEETIWRTARRGAAALASCFFDEGVDVVVVEGSFHDSQECDDVRKYLASKVDHRLFTLNVSFPEALRRVEADPAPDRILSRDPKVLRFLHDQFVNALPFLETSSIVIDADSLTATELAETMIESLKGAR